MTKTDQPKWMPSDEEINKAIIASCELMVDQRDGLVSNFGDTEALRALIRTAVERALAEWERVWVSALKEVNGEAVCHRDFREMWAKAESSPTYWAELLRLSMESIRNQEARHKREVIEARLDTLAGFGDCVCPVSELSSMSGKAECACCREIYRLRAELSKLQTGGAQ